MNFFSYFATLWKWYCLRFWIGKKSRFFQYSVICHFSKYIRLSLADFNKNKVFYREWMWLLLRQNSPKETRENLLSGLLFVLMLTSKKSKNTDAFLWTRADYLSFRHQRVCSGKTKGSHLEVLNLLLKPPKGRMDGFLPGVLGKMWEDVDIVQA